MNPNEDDQPMLYKCEICKKGFQHLPSLSRYKKTHHVPRSDDGGKNECMQSLHLNFHQTRCSHKTFKAL